jgi:hypothetical protein
MPEWRRTRGLYFRELAWHPRVYQRLITQWCQATRKRCFLLQPFEEASKVDVGEVDHQIATSPARLQSAIIVILVGTSVASKSQLAQKRHHILSTFEGLVPVLHDRARSRLNAGLLLHGLEMPLSASVVFISSRRSKSCMARIAVFYIRARVCNLAMTVSRINCTSWTAIYFHSFTKSSNPLKTVLSKSTIILATTFVQPHNIIFGRRVVSVNNRLTGSTTEM